MWCVHYIKPPCGAQTAVVPLMAPKPCMWAVVSCCSLGVCSVLVTVLGYTQIELWSSVVQSVFSLPSVRVRVYVHACVCACVCTYVCVCLCKCVCMRACVLTVYVYVCVRACIQCVCMLHSCCTVHVTN